MFMKLLRFFEFVQEWDDLSLSIGVKNKNKKAENYFYEKYFKSLYYYIKSRTSTLDNEEINIVVNNAITRGMTKIELFDNKGSLEGWMKKIASNCLSDYIKSNKKESEVIYKEKLPEKGYNPEQADLEKQIKAKFQMFKKELTPLQIKIIDMYLNGYKHKEIADELNMSEGTSKWHVNDIMNKFKNWYKKNKDI
jgi:RNA polymerase sigma factor (sigma-70 family)